MADYFEAQAAHLRRVGEQKHQRENREFQPDPRDLKRQKALVIAGYEALDLVEKGVEKNAACNRIATVFNLLPLHVQANFERAKRERSKSLRHERIKKAHLLKKRGFSQREIAHQLGVPKSTIHTILKQSP